MSRETSFHKQYHCLYYNSMLMHKCSCKIILLQLLKSATWYCVVLKALFSLKKDKNGCGIFFQQFQRQRDHDTFYKPERLSRRNKEKFYISFMCVRDSDGKTVIQWLHGVTGFCNLKGLLSWWARLFLQTALLIDFK